MSSNPFILFKLVLWVIVVIVATILLQRRKVTSKARLFFLVGGVLIFGFFFGFLIPGGLNPNPVASLRTLMTGVLFKHKFLLPVFAMLVFMLLMVVISNKSICGWNCQLGLLQELLYRVSLPKWKPPFWLSNTIRIVAFAAFISGLILANLDLIGFIDPFQLFSFNFSLAIGIFSVVILFASLFVYRPWCNWLCPFGLLGWLMEQVSIFRPRIKREACKECKLCIKACPGQAMSDFYHGKKIHADCFACGACIDACPQDNALGWRKVAHTCTVADVVD